MSLSCVAMLAVASLTMGWLSTLAVRLAMVLYCFLMDIIWRLVGRRKALIDLKPRVVSIPSLINLMIGQTTKAKVTAMKMIVAIILRKRGKAVRAEEGKGVVDISILQGWMGPRWSPTC